MNDFKITIAEYSDSQLLAEYHENLDDYTDEAADFLNAEISRRGLAKELLAVNETADSELLSFTSDDLELFDHSFSRTDLSLVTSILREHNVPFFVENSASSSSFPTVGEADMRHTIRVHKNFVAKAHELLDGHFAKADMKYLLKCNSIRDRFAMLTFQDLLPRENVRDEELSITFSPEEREVFLHLGKRLVAEADAIEKQRDQFLFFYDSIEEVMDDISSGNTLSRTDLLTLFEIVQVYLNDADLPSFMDKTLEELLSFFIGRIE